MSLSKHRLLGDPRTRAVKSLNRHRNRLMLCVDYVREGCPGLIRDYFESNGASTRGAIQLLHSPYIQAYMETFLKHKAKTGLTGAVGKVVRILNKDVKDELPMRDVVGAGEFLGKAAYGNFSKNQEAASVNVQINLPLAGGASLSVEAKEKIDDEWKAIEAKVKPNES